LSLGARAIELDVQMTKDGQLVVIHDSDVARTTNGSGAVASFEASDITSLDAGSWFSPDFAGEHVPTLAEVLDLTNGKARVNIDLRADPARPVASRVIEEVCRCRAGDRVVLMSLDLGAVLAAKRHATSAKFRDEVGKLVIVPIVTERLAGPLGFVKGCGLDGLNYPLGQWDEALVKSFRDQGLVVHGGLVNDVGVLSEFFARGGTLADSDNLACFG
jgi:glycerophosphoryl diester phosphodiesterase